MSFCCWLFPTLLPTPIAVQVPADTDGKREQPDQQVEEPPQKRQAVQLRSGGLAANQENTQSLQNSLQPNGSKDKILIMIKGAGGGTVDFRVWPTTRVAQILAVYSVRYRTLCSQMAHLDAL